MDISQDIAQAQKDYEAIMPKLEEILHRIRCLRHTGRAGKKNLRRIRCLELDILEMQNFLQHQSGKVRNIVISIDSWSGHCNINNIT